MAMEVIPEVDHYLDVAHPMKTATALENLDAPVQLIKVDNS